mmetsp:Transcript_13264/g.31599  ORF Transcript_13264/g.31599 Transcript_13264/m.31599 type:complete len:217 (+) Transcript_13264:342-992(+)
MCRFIAVGFLGGLHLGDYDTRVGGRRCRVPSPLALMAQPHPKWHYLGPLLSGDSWTLDLRHRRRFPHCAASYGPDRSLAATPVLSMPALSFRRHVGSGGPHAAGAADPRGLQGPHPPAPAPGCEVQGRHGSVREPPGETGQHHLRVLVYHHPVHCIRAGRQPYAGLCDLLHRQTGSTVGDAELVGHLWHPGLLRSFSVHDVLQLGDCAVHPCAVPL